MLTNWLLKLFHMFSPLTQFGGWGVAAWLAGIVLTMSWVIGLNKTIRQSTARVAGPVSLTVFTAMFGFSLVYVIAGLISGFVMGIINAIPFMRWFPQLGSAVGGLIGSIVQPILMIGLAVYGLKNAPKIFEGLFRSIYNPLQKGYNLNHLLAGSAAVGFVVNSAWLNQSTFFIPMILSAVLGLYTLVGVRPKWSQIKYELAMGHAVEFGTLPNDQKIKTKKDRQVMREAYVEVDRAIKETLEEAERARELAEAEVEVAKFLSGQDEEDKWAELEKKMKVRVRIAEQLGMKLELETEEQTRARIKVAKEAEERAAAEAAAEAAQAEADAQEEQRKILH